MKIGTRTTLFNFTMREARTARGWSQKRLGEEVGCGIGFINEVETLRMPQNSLATIVHLLNKIAFALELPLETLFPSDYLDAILAKKLPRRRKPILWVREIELDSLPLSSAVLMLPSAEDEVIEEESVISRAQLDHLLGSLSQKEQQVITLRFGLDDGQEKSLKEVAAHIGQSIEGARTIEARALRKLRHPDRSGGLRASLYEAVDSQP